MGYFTVLFIITFVRTGNALEECFKCEGKESSKECMKGRDFCNAGMDRCMSMEYKNANGTNVYNSFCKREAECGTEAGKMILCEKKKDCKVTVCCKENLCNRHRNALEECFKCEGKESSKECMKDRDFCAPGMDRCMSMEYKNANGKKVFNSFCKKEEECGTEAGKMVLCEGKKDCKVTVCCKENLCNGKSGVTDEAATMEFDISIHVLVFMIVILTLWR